MTVPQQKQLNEFKEIINSYTEPTESVVLFSVINNKIEELSTSGNLEIIKVVDISVSYLRSKLSALELVKFLLDTANWLFIHGDKNISLEFYNRIIKLSKKMNNKSISDVLAESHMGMANIWAREGNWNDANIHIRKAKAIYSKMNKREGLALTENFLGTIYAENGETTKAKEQFEYALSFLSHSRAKVVRSKINNNLGIVFTMMQRYSSAKEYLLSALEGYSEIKNESKEAEILHNIGMLHLKEGEYSEALSNFELSYKIAKENNLHPITGISLLGLAEVHIILNQIDKANTYLIECQDISYKINDRLTLADSFKVESWICKNQNDFQAAETLLQTSVKINEEFKNFGNLAESHLELGKLYKELQKEQSNDYLLKALKFYRKSNNAEMINTITSLLSN
jgi:tetratricopeptide (TPR) repeat protein